MAAPDETGPQFGSSRPFSIGVEEELFLVDPVTGDQVNVSPAVRERVGEVDGEIAPELHACQVELITQVCTHGGRGGRCAGGDAPGPASHRRRASSAPGRIPPRPRAMPRSPTRTATSRSATCWGTPPITPVSGLHVHVGMPDADTAIRAFNHLRSHLPLLQALSANSPFRHGRDTGLASARELTLQAWPRSGTPRALHDFDDFCAMADRLVRAADVADYTWFWWKLRPHPRLGTVEVRALDVQGSLQDAAAIVALTHCLARSAAEQSSSPDVAPELVEEGLFRAARFGTAARLPDSEGALRTVDELLADALSVARRHAPELGCSDELELLPGLLERGGGAGRQRRFHELAGMGALLRELTLLTGG